MSTQCRCVIPQMKRHIKCRLRKFPAVVIQNSPNNPCGGTTQGFQLNDLIGNEDLMERMIMPEDIIKWNINGTKAFAVPIVACKCNPCQKYYDFNYFANAHGSLFFGDVVIFRAKKDAEKFITGWKEAEHKSCEE
jgi:hypothetical protein